VTNLSFELVSFVSSQKNLTMEDYIIINGTVKFSHKEVCIIFLKIFGFTIADIADYTGYSGSDINARCSGITDKLGLPNCKCLIYGALLNGFDIHGRFRGKFMLDEYEQQKLKTKASWVVLKPNE